jgi:hypothetical protein
MSPTLGSTPPSNKPFGISLLRWLVSLPRQAAKLKSPT